MSGLIGGNYVSIDMGSPGSPPLADGAEIRTVESPDLNTIMSEIGGLGKQLQDSLGSFSTALNGERQDGGIIQKLDKLVTDNSARVDATMQNLQEIPGKINRGEGTLGSLSTTRSCTTSSSRPWTRSRPRQPRPRSSSRAPSP
jgi:phospholipid/cholesterol/gamma-HCH transport system substrate-binding protein